jgi:hypothetical protein
MLQQSKVNNSNRLLFKYKSHELSVQTKLQWFVEGWHKIKIILIEMWHLKIILDYNRKMQ